MSTSPGHLVLVPETRPTHGFGHLQRSIALGEAWMDAGGTVTVMVDPDVGAAAERVQRVGLDHIALPAAGDRVATVLRAVAEADWCVFDGYDLGAELHEAASAVTSVAVIDDDGHTETGAVDVVIDDNPGADASRYDGVAPVVLAGSDYALLGRSHRTGEPSGDRDRFVVVMGGQPSPDVVQFTHDVLAQMTIPARSIDVVGPLADGAPDEVRPIDADASLGPVFRQARLGFSAAGSTTWELAAAGTPSVLLTVADNQERIAAAATELGVGRSAGRVGELDPTAVAASIDELWNDATTRDAMAARGRALIDGRGPERVVQALLATSVRR